MKNIFGKDEILISCSSLRNIPIGENDLHKLNHAILITDSNLQLLSRNLTLQASMKAKVLADRIAAWHKNRNINDTCTIITEILISRRYRGGKREGSGIENIYDKVKKSVDSGLPIQLTISLYPCKIPNRLKTGGILPDIGEMVSLIRLKEIAEAVKNVYYQGLQIIVLTDGYRFREVMGFPDYMIEPYQRVLQKFSKLLNLDETVKIVNYTDILSNNLPKQILENKYKLYKKLLNEYGEIFGTNVDAVQIEKRLNEIINIKSDQELRRKFIDLYLSLLYSVFVPEIIDNVNNDRLTVSVYSDLFNFDSKNKLINGIRKNIIEDTWQRTIKYMAEITAGRITKPVEYIYPNSIRCDMHNIAGRLTLYPITRSTKLTPFHSSGYINKKGEVSVNFRVLLMKAKFIPINGRLMGEDYSKQPFAYIDPTITDNIETLIKEGFVKIK